MDLLKDRRVIVAIGGVLVVGLALALAFAILHHDKPSSVPPPASQTGLVIDVTQNAEVKRDPNREYRCFKDGQYVGMATLEACAKKNGVLSGALDVGIDQTGALAAADQFGAAVAPLPPGQTATPATPASPTAPAAGAAPVAVTPAQPLAPAVQAPPRPAPAPQATRTPSASCQRYDHGWANLGDMTLNTCLQALYAARCARPGQALYGRWGDQTLRLVPGRVEQSRDERTFRTLVEQGQACTIPPL